MVIYGNLFVIIRVIYFILKNSFDEKSAKTMDFVMFRMLSNHVSTHSEENLENINMLAMDFICNNSSRLFYFKEQF